MQLFKGKFVKGVIGDNYCLGNDLPQIAFFGRSNAGKSSVINSLIENRNLVKTSKKPGKTRQANFFLINDSFYFIDFPGYGYAKFSIKERNKIIQRIFWYIEKWPKKPRAIFLISDIKVGLTELDLQMIEILNNNNHKIVIVANKADKISKSQQEKQIEYIKKQIPGITVLGYSAKIGKNKEDLINQIINHVN